jgi:hypothetical protein
MTTERNNANHPDQHNRRREDDAMRAQVAANKSHRTVAAIWAKAAIKALWRGDHDVAQARFDQAILELRAIR